jgi:hypothetical protein
MNDVLVMHKHQSYVGRCHPKLDRVPCETWAGVIVWALRELPDNSVVNTYH